MTPPSRGRESELSDAVSLVDCHLREAVDAGAVHFLGAPDTIERSHGPVGIAAHRTAQPGAGILGIAVGPVRPQVEQPVFVVEIDTAIVARSNAVPRIAGNRVAKDVRLRVPGDEDPAALVVLDRIAHDPGAGAAGDRDAVPAGVPDRIRAVAQWAEQVSDPRHRTLGDINAAGVHVLDRIARDAAHAAVIQMDAVPAGLADGVPHDIGGRARGHSGQVNPVAPAGDGKALHRNLPAADEESIAFGGRLDHSLSLAVESDANHLGENGDVLAAGAADLNRVAGLGNCKLVLDFLSGIAINGMRGRHIGQWSKGYRYGDDEARLDNADVSAVMTPPP